MTPVVSIASGGTGTLTSRVPIGILARGMAVKRDYYEILGVSRDASQATIKAALDDAQRRIEPMMRG